MPSNGSIPGSPNDANQPAAIFIMVNITEADASDMLETDTPSGKSVYTMNFSGTDANDIEITQDTGLNSVYTYTMITDPTDSDIQTAMSKYGAKITFTSKSNAPDEVDIEWPKAQRTGQAFIISGPVQTVTTTGAGEVESAVVTKIEVGAALLDSEVADIAAQNSIIVGGPCVNDAAAEVMGLSPGTCGAASTIPENKAIIKLFEQTGGNVAMVVAGWGAMDTRRASRVVANYADYALSGTEMEVSGTDLTTITVAAPVVEVAVEEEAATE